MAKLKVYRASLGFFDTVVAAPSQRAALAAWGTHQDLFKDGSAKVTDDAAATAAAIAQPGVVLRRGLGTSGAFLPADQPSPSSPLLPDAPAGGRRPAPKPKLPSRARLTGTETALEAARSRQATLLADIAARRRALDQDEAEAHRNAEVETAQLGAEFDAARQAYLAAGGDDDSPASRR